VKSNVNYDRKTTDYKGSFIQLNTVILACYILFSAYETLYGLTLYLTSQPYDFTWNNCSDFTPLYYSGL